ncbi:unnamed protein product, partial [Rotaria sp. Silwood2]
IIIIRFFFDLIQLAQKRIMSAISMKCKLSIELLVKHDFLRNNDKCTFCSQFIAMHLYRKELDKEINKSSMHVQHANVKIKDNVDYECEQLAIGEKGMP